MTNNLRRSAGVLGVAATFILLGIISLLIWGQFDNTHRARYWVQHTIDVITTADELGFAVRDAETGQRGYLLTGRTDYLPPYRDALGHIADLQSYLLRLTADNPGQQTRLNGLTPLLRRKLDELAQTVALRRDVGFDAAVAVVQSNLGLRLMVQIVTILHGVRDTEGSLLEERRQDLDQTEASTLWFAVAGATSGLALLLFAGHLLAENCRQLEKSGAEQLAFVGQIRTVFDSISQGIAAFSDDGRALRWNQRFSTLLGLRPLMRSGVSYEALTEQLAADGAEFLETLEQIQHGSSGHGPDEAVVYQRTRAADNRRFEFRRSAMPNGGFVLTVTDMTVGVRADTSARRATPTQVG